MEVSILPLRKNKGYGFCVLPGYNWCGPGCHGPGPPINDVDAACQAHDYCYGIGRHRCECDQEFLNYLRPQIDYYTQEGRHARLIYHYMKLQTMFTCHSYRG